LRTFNQAVGPIVAVDTGVLLEYLTGTDNGKKIDQLVFKNSFIISISVSPLTIVEIYYIVRRKTTSQRTKTVVRDLKKLVKIIPIEEYLEELTGEVKAETSFSIADSAIIALAEYRDIPVIFKKEQEIENKLKKTISKRFTSQIIFIDDFI
jgi:predicted nucleic acid-binding protein